MRIFFDTSAFAKRYVREAGSDAVLALCDQAAELCLAAIAIPELVSAFCRLHRDGHLTPQQYTALKTGLFRDIVDIAICDLSPTVIHQTVMGLEQNRLRAMDAIHIGCAVALQVDTFVTADARQCDAARQAGLTVIYV